MPTTLDLPYERQVNTLSTRMCGAAALCMVYRSLGLACSQEEVWPAIAPPIAEGDACARTYLLCADALRRGFAALTLQARYALPLLRTALEGEVRVIVNHRQGLNSLAGHYSVVLAVDEECVAIHDPWLGPARRLEHAEWLKLWRPGPSNREVSGNLAVFIGRHSAEPHAAPEDGLPRPSREPSSANNHETAWEGHPPDVPAARGVPRCRLCEAVIPPAVPCPACRNDIPLRPSAVLGCPDGNCPARMWSSLFCPWCDAAIDRLD
ncbi:MAG TPA: papain-like cysteine protease family protein [Pirellulales bacterium]|nr:papain-like cysteine protease family protein [Pirellulales bacterium]